MRQHILASVLAVAFLGSPTVPGAQISQNSESPNPSQNPAQSQSPAQDTLHLTQDQQKSVSQGLSGQQQQSPPAAFDGQVGSKVPDSMTTHSVPNNVTAQVPETKGYLFVKMPDRVLLINPESKTVVEIVADVP